MHRVFLPLSRQQSALLLTLMMRGGAEHLDLLELLPEDLQPLLKEKAQLLLQISGEKRALFIAHEFKGLLTEPSERGIEAIDATWLVDAMQRESPRVVAAIMIGLSSHQLKSVVDKLPPDLRKRLPPKEEMKAVPLEVIRSIRLKFEERFETMPMSFGTKTFTFHDIISLEPPEILLVLRALGLEELAQAFVSVGRYALAELCKRLPREFAQELIAAVRLTQVQDAMELKSAQRFLGRVLVNFKDTDELSHKAGLYRLAKTMAPEPPNYIRAFMQRIPMPLANQLETYLQKVAELNESDPDRARRLQDAALRRVYALAQEKKISTRWLEMQFQYNEAAQ